MDTRFACLVLLLVSTFLHSQNARISVLSGTDGKLLLVDGEPFMVNGVNWDYVPIGDGILDRGIWDKDDNLIKQALDAEMSLLKNMGGNAIRTYGLKPKWVQYIYEKHGIYTMINTQFGAYGVPIKGKWISKTDYADKAVIEVLMKEVRDMALTYKDTPGLLLYMIGNENNYHLSWEGAETEAIPDDEVDAGKKAKARALYRAFNNAVKEVKKIDGNHPVAICNGDLLYLDLVKEECTDIDIYGTNMYRGVSFGDAFDRVKNELDLPILFSEFGADAFNARDKKEDQFSQAYYNLGNWKEIYQNASGLSGVGNSLGGFTFQFSDGWWKYKQTEDLDVHNNTATWANDGYSRDQALPGDNNMNEEWFGICAKGPTDANGMYKLQPRATYYVLKRVHGLNPYEDGMTIGTLMNNFENISIDDALVKAGANHKN